MADVLSLSQAAALLGVAASTLRHQAQAGRLRATLVGKTWIVTSTEVERYRREHKGRKGRPRKAESADVLYPTLVDGTFVVTDADIARATSATPAPGDTDPETGRRVERVTGSMDEPVVVLED